MTPYDYVAVGHVTCDLLADGDAETRQPGGTAFYGALQAARLGLRALILTRGVPSEIEALLAAHRDEIDLRVIPAPETTTLATRAAPGEHGTDIVRSQRVLSWAGPIAEPLVVEARILHLAPVARETPAHWEGKAGFVGVTPQGLVRNWPDEEIEAVELDRELLPERFNAAVISEHERPSCEPLFAAARGCGACVAVTDGPRAGFVHTAGGAGGRVLRSATPYSVAVRDDLGAGDVFAAAFFVALAERRDALAATSFANAAAAIRISGSGPGAIGTRAQIESLLA